MEILGQIGGFAYCIAALVVGLRLIWLAARTHELPELLIGVSVLFLASLGYPLSAAARQAPGLAVSSRAALGATAGVLAAVGLVANTIFIWVVFRRGSGWASALLVTISLATLGIFYDQSLQGGWAEGARFWGTLPVLITLSYGWACLECGRYTVLLRRRLRLGIAEPVVANRFGLYTVATGMALTTNVVGFFFWHLHLEMLTNPLGGPVLFLLGSGSSVLMMLAFLPPRAYREWVRARAPRAA